MVIKRLAANKIWHLKRRTVERYAIDPKPGPHAKAECLPLGYILRDILRVAENMREVRSILNGRRVKVDNIVRIDAAFPTGLMDVVTLDNTHWRVLPYSRGLKLVSISGDDAKVKLLEVRNKTSVKGKIQLNFHDGGNLLVDKDVYKTGDVLTWSLAERKVVGHMKFKRGALGLVVGGKNRGTVGKIENIIIARGPYPNTVTLRVDKRILETKYDYVFIVGQEKPIVELGAK
jgi:small subunit ribosomal protein S4e